MSGHRSGLRPEAESGLLIREESALELPPRRALHYPRDSMGFLVYLRKLLRNSPEPELRSPCSQHGQGPASRAGQGRTRTPGDDSTRGGLKEWPSIKELAMRLTTKGRFAVTAMIDLALRQNNGPVTLAAISQRQQISLSYLEQLFGKLRRHELVESTRGPGGGYSLGRKATDITVADIIV